ncbi:hypothetical protein ACFFMS_16030 [Ectobacillus funiculus]|uniref:Uncharacterized protein n=1 Tax=Ectobacillus funiculus TaxID=137993 RepID=A0ABV5WH17_9BACI
MSKISQAGIFDLHTRATFQALVHAIIPDALWITTLGVAYAARGLTESIRADVSLMFSKIIMKKTMAGLTLKQYLEQHEWLRIPPYYKE